MIKLILPLILLFPFSLYAKKEEESQFLKKSLKYINQTHQYISSSWVGLNYDVDVFFSDQKYEKNENKSKLITSYEIYKHESQDLVTAFGFKVKVHLPKVSKRLSIVIEKERDRIVESRSNNAKRSEAISENNYNAGVSYVVHKSKFWRTSFDTGVRLTLPLNPFAKFKAYHETVLPIFKIYLGQEVMLYRHEGLSELTQLLLTKKISESIRISQNNVLSWTDDNLDLILRNSLSLTHRLDDKRDFSYNIGANAYVHPDYYYYRYDASISYHRLLYKKWLYGNFSVGTEFNKSDNFKMQSFVLVRFSVFFL